MEEEEEEEDGEEEVGGRGKGGSVMRRVQLQHSTRQSKQVSN